MATSGRNVEADSSQALLRVFLTMSAVWLIFWALLGGMFFTAAGPGLTSIGDVRLLCLAAFAPPAALLTIGLFAAEAWSRTARSASKPRGPLTRTIGVGRE